MQPVMFQRHGEIEILGCSGTVLSCFPVRLGTIISSDRTDYFQILLVLHQCQRVLASHIFDQPSNIGLGLRATVSLTTLLNTVPHHTINESDRLNVISGLRSGPYSD